MTEFFAHNVSVIPSNEEEQGTSELFILTGKDWDNNPFKLWLNENEAKVLSVQLGYLLYETE